MVFWVIPGNQLEMVHLVSRVSLVENIRYVTILCKYILNDVYVCLSQPGPGELRKTSFFCVFYNDIIFILTVIIISMRDSRTECWYQ